MSTSRRATTFIMASSPGRWCGGPPIRSCYPRACDTTENIDREVLEQNTRALVRVLRAVAISAPTVAATAATATSSIILIVDVKLRPRADQLDFAKRPSALRPAARYA
jgi:hypothetical protein